MKENDLNKVAKIEQAIKEKYGEEAVHNPKGSWNQEKEKKYLEDLKQFYEKNNYSKKTQQQKGFKLKTRKVKRDCSRTCPVCGSYSFSSSDDLYMTKFQCCYKCYIQYVEGREERWKSGWRPNN